jgi:hypothetical protein
MLIGPTCMKAAVSNMAGEIRTLKYAALSDFNLLESFHGPDPFSVNPLFNSPRSYQMDPLSVAASVVGLLAAAQKTSSAIRSIITIRKSGSEEIIRLKTTIDTLKSVLLQLQLLLINRATLDHSRASMILVDEVVLTLTACVMIFSDLDQCMNGLESDHQLGLGWLDSIRWAAKAPELDKYTRNLEAHKTSQSLMMNILTWYGLEYMCSGLKLTSIL